MAKAKNIKDKRFGKLVAVERHSMLDKNKHSVWCCRCDCGRVINVTLTRLTGKHPMESCGCAPKPTMTKLTQEKNFVYTERAHLVSALSKVFPAWIEIDSDEQDPEFKHVVYVMLPGVLQCSWYVKTSEMFLFDHLEIKKGSSWDGHTTQQKYARLAGLEPLWSRYAVDVAHSLSH